jgi:hypothetical protein
MTHVRRLIESRPMLSRVPDQSLIVDARSGMEHVQATRGDDYAFVYLPVGGRVEVRPEAIQGRCLNASWFDPRTGQTTALGTPAKKSTLEFEAPSSGRGNDWVLVLDDAARGYPPAGE